MHRYAILTLLCAVTMASCGGSASSPAERSSAAAPRHATRLTRHDAERLARAYVEAFNRHDGGAICAAWSPAVRAAVVRMWAPRTRVRGCAAIARTWIGYGEDAGMGVWTHARLISVRPARLVGRRASVPIVERHFHGRNGGEDLTVRDVIHLGFGAHGWRVAKPGLIWFAAIGATQVPDSELDPPAVPRMARRHHLAAPTFRCGRSRTAVADAAADVAATTSPGQAPASGAPTPWLDVRRVTISSTYAGTCVAIELTAPPRPESRLVFHVEQPTGRRHGEFRLAGADLRIDAFGRAHASAEALGPRLLSDVPPPPRQHAPRVGARGTTVYLLLPKALLARRPFEWQLAVSSTQADDPNVARPAVGTDAVGPATYRP